MAEPVIEYIKSPRREKLEKQYRDSIVRGVDEKLGSRIANLEKSILILSSELTRLRIKLNGGTDA